MGLPSHLNIRTVSSNTVMKPGGIVRVEGESALAVAPPALEFTDEQRQMIRDTFANGASDEEFAVLMEIARARRLNPLLRQIHFVSRWDSEKRRPVWAAQVSIDGLRAIAERTGLYAGQDEPEFVENPDGTLRLCKVRVYRKDWARPAVGIAYWTEYVQTMRDKATGKNRPTAMWLRMPHTMLSKCAEALALRKAFPEDMSGLYTTEEMMQATNPFPQVPYAMVPAPHAARRPLAPAVPPVAAVEVTNVTVAATTDAAPANDTTTADDDDAPPPAPPNVPPLEAFFLKVTELTQLGDAVALWVSARAMVAALPRESREAAWKMLCKRVAAIGDLPDPHTWLRKAVADLDAARQTQTATAQGARKKDPWLDYLG